MTALKETEAKGTTKPQDTSTTFPWVWRFPIDCHCEPGKNRNHCPKHWALAQVKGSCTVWHVQSLRLDWRRNSNPSRLVLASWIWRSVLTEEQRDRAAGAVWFLGPGSCTGTKKQQEGTRTPLMYNTTSKFCLQEQRLHLLNLSTGPSSNVLMGEAAPLRLSWAAGIWHGLQSKICCFSTILPLSSTCFVNPNLSLQKRSLVHFSERQLMVFYPPLFIYNRDPDHQLLS